MADRLNSLTTSSAVLNPVTLAKPELPAAVNASLQQAGFQTPASETPDATPDCQQCNAVTN